MSELAPPLRDALTLALAFVAGVLSGAFSMGGQVLMKPGIRLLGASALDAVGTTVPMILPTVASATVRYARQGLIEWTIVRWAAPIGAVGAVAGSLAAPRVPGGGHLLQLATAVLMATSGLRILRHPPVVAPAQDVPAAPAPRPTTAPPPARHAAYAVVGGASGLISGLLGVGGGVLMVPAFTQILRLPLLTSIATSLVCAGAFAIPATIAHASLGTIHWRFAILLIVGAVPGARVGASLAMRASDRRLRTAVGIVMTIVAVTYAAGELSALTDR